MKLPKSDKLRKIEAYMKKFDEYESMSLDELIALERSGTVKGTYLEALTNMIKLKTSLNEKEKPT